MKNISTFKTFFFISSGAWNAMYTLRVFTQDFDSQGKKQNVTFYVRNLSTDYDKAVEKANHYASIEGFPLNLNVGIDADTNLNEIVRGERRPSEEVIRANIERAQADSARIDSWTFRKSIRVFNGGKWEGEAIVDVLAKDRDYLEWLASTDNDSLQTEFIRTVLENNADERTPSEHVGQVKERITVEGMVTFDKVTESYYGASKMLKLEDSDNNVFTVFYSGGSDDIWNLEAGDNVKIVGTVKKHDEYNDIKQTILTRIKLG